MDISEIVSRSRSFNDDVDKLRCIWESRAHWNVRKSFLLHNWDKFKDKDRLICLSQAWVNVHFSGNKYPRDVMDTLKDMEEGLENPKKILQDSEMQVIGAVDHSRKILNVHDTSKLPHTIFPMKFVKEKDNLINKEEDSLIDKASDMTLKKETEIIKNLKKRTSDAVAASESENNVTEKKKKLCETIITPGLVSKNTENTFPVSKPLSFTDAKCDKIMLNSSQTHALDTLVLRQRREESVLSIIQSSADFCRFDHEYVFEQHYTAQKIHRFSCSLYVNKILVGRAHANDKKSAKHAAANSALELLRKDHPTILISEMPGDLESAISRKDIITSGNSSEQKITDANLGNQLLRKMGWTGQGGLGKTGSGISEPVSVSETYGRAGLGIESRNANLISFKDAHDVIRNYASSQSRDELTFSPELKNDERAKIHKLARRYGLRSRSYNKSDIRYLVVSRKMTAAALVSELKMAGGNIRGVQLIGPGNFQIEDTN